MILEALAKLADVSDGGQFILSISLASILTCLLMKVVDGSLQSFR